MVASPLGRELFLVPTLHLPLFTQGATTVTVYEPKLPVSSLEPTKSSTS